jgi:hypothetical protein
MDLTPKQINKQIKREALLASRPISNGKKYQAKIKINQKQIVLGQFTTIKEASQCFEQKRQNSN